MVVRWVTAMAAGVAGLAACGSGASGSDPASEPRTRPGPSSAAVSSPGTSPSAGTVQEPRLLLRWRTSGGVAGLGGPGSIPDFSLYDDGRAVALDPADRTPGALRDYRLRPQALRSLLDGARAAGLDRSRSVGPQDDLADALVLEITFGSATTRVTRPGGGADDPANRFVKRLSPQAWAPADQAAPVRPYEPRRMALLTGEMDPSIAGNGPAERWPLARLGRGEQAGGGLCTVLDGPGARAALRLARESRPGTRWRSGGKVYSVRFRPLLPEESSCRELA